jgi:hypothetical protein
VDSVFWQEKGCISLNLLFNSGTPKGIGSNAEQKKPFSDSTKKGFAKIPAVSYSPTQSPV